MPAASRSAVEALIRRGLGHEAAGQLLRFAVAGLGVTLFAASIYLALTLLLGLPPLVANSFSTACGVAAGYTAHSRWSFRAEPERRRTSIPRFLIVAGLGFVLNSTWVWIATTALPLPAWAPVPAMIFVTPLASFALNRYWVFART